MADIHVRVDERSLRALSDFARQRGVSMSAMATAVGRWLDDHPEPPEHLEKCLDGLVQEAEAIDAERRDRRPG